jgi:hypothetical protein
LCLPKWTLILLFHWKNREIQDPTTGELEVLRALKRAIERYGNPSLREIVRKGKSTGTGTNTL